MQAPTPALEADDLSVMQKAIEESACRGRVAEHLAPVFHRAIGGDQNRSGLISAGTKLSIVPGSLIVTRNGNWCR